MLYDALYEHALVRCSAQIELMMIYFSVCLATKNFFKRQKKEFYITYISNCSFIFPFRCMDLCEIPPFLVNEDKTVNIRKDRVIVSDRQYKSKMQAMCFLFYCLIALEWCLYTVYA